MKYMSMNMNTILNENCGNGSHNAINGSISDYVVT
jgi:hypothetical protein